MLAAAQAQLAAASTEAHEQLAAALHEARSDLDAQQSGVAAAEAAALEARSRVATLHAQLAERYCNEWKGVGEMPARPSQVASSQQEANSVSS